METFARVDVLKRFFEEFPAAHEVWIGPPRYPDTDAWGITLTDVEGNILMYREVSETAPRKKVL